MENNTADSEDFSTCPGGGPGGPELPPRPVPRPPAPHGRDRLDARLQARLDASDVVQEAYAEVAERLDEYLARSEAPVFLWLRLVVGERLMKLHRHHLGTQMRDAGREVSLYRAPAGGQLGRAGRPVAGQAHVSHPGRVAPNGSSACRRRSIRSNRWTARSCRSRHFEELTAAETARVLGIEESAAAKRYFRALKRLKVILAAMPGGARRRVV